MIHAAIPGTLRRSILVLACAVAPGAGFAQESMTEAVEGLMPGFLAAGGAFDSANPDLVIGIRAGVEVGPAYLGSDDYEFGPDGAVRIDYLRFPNGFEFGSSATVGFRTGWGLQGSARYIGARDSDDYSELEGLENIDWSFEAGLGLGYEQRNYRVFADVRYGIIGHNAWVGDIGADAIAYPMDGLTLTFGPRVELGDSRFSDTYFGVSAEEAANSDLEQFDASGGVLGAGVELGARYLFNERWGVEGAASWGRLMNDAADSPITAEGSADQYRVRVGLTRRISLDF
jgi:outer membrane scaffolding protein for murein synthesis (MipA/OmpV family)